MTSTRLDAALAASLPESKIVDEFILPPEGINEAKVLESFLKQALALAKGNQSQAARLLNITRYALRYRMARLAAGGNPRAPSTRRQ